MKHYKHILFVVSMILLAYIATGMPALAIVAGIIGAIFEFQEMEGTDAN